MKKLLTLIALLTVSVWFAGCGESAPQKAPTPTPPVSKGPEDGAKTEESAPAEGEKKEEAAPAENAAPSGDAAPAEKKEE